MWEQLEEARRRIAEQSRELDDLEHRLGEEERQADSFYGQLRDTRQHLFAMKGQVRERAVGMMADCDMLLEVASEPLPRVVGARSADWGESQDSVGFES